MLKKLFLVALALLVTGCSQSLYTQGRNLSDEGDYDRAITTLYEEIKVNPANAEAWRELGVAFYKKGDLDKAAEALQQATKISPDSRAYLYLGLIQEKKENYGHAIDAYRAALGLKPKSSTADMVRQRLDELLVFRVKEEATFALKNEAGIDVDTIPQNTIAVVDFDNTYLSPEMAPISKGLAEFTANDLAKVHSLTVVDRLKIDVILQELRLGTSGHVDPGSAPRVGRLLGSNRIVTGSLVGLGDEVIRLDGAVVNTRDSSTQITAPTEGDATAFFKIQKDFVFDVIDNLGITLTAEERNAIEEVPTESYLAFLAYCRGLDYKSRGMFNEAQREFGRAAGADGGFREAQTQRQATARKAAAPPGGEPAPLASFENELVSAVEEALDDAGLGQFQTTSLENTGFMRDMESYFQFGDFLYSPLRILSGYGVIIIRGNLDVQP